MYSLPFRFILWTFVMAYSGFFFAGRGAWTLDRNTIAEALIGAVLGGLIAVMFTLRSRRRHRVHI